MVVGLCSGKTCGWVRRLKNSFPDLFDRSLQEVATIREMRDNQVWDTKFRRSK